MATMALVRRDHRELRDAVRDYSSGLIALVPVLALLLLIRVVSERGAWPASQVIAFSLGITGSLLVTTGFVQSLSRRGSICLSLGDPEAARRYLTWLFVLVEIVAVALAVIVALTTRAMGLFSDPDRLTFGVTLVGVSTFWLAAAGLSIARAQGWIGVALSAGLATGAVADVMLTPVLASHLIVAAVAGLVVAVGIVGWRSERILSRHATVNVGQPVLPAVAYLIDEALPYFGYGVLYMLLIVVAHAVGWFGRLGPTENWSSAVSTLEVGLTLALPPIILAGGVAERALHLFWREALVGQATTPGDAPTQFSRRIERFYWRYLIRYLLALGTLSLLARYGFDLAAQAGWLAGLAAGDLSLLTRVFDAGLITYWLLGWAQFNCTFAVSLARPSLALRSVAVGIATTLVVGLPLCLGIGFAYAVLAFGLGAAAFVVASHFIVARSVVKNAGYYYVRSF